MKKKQPRFDDPYSSNSYGATIIGNDPYAKQNLTKSGTASTFGNMFQKVNANIGKAEIPPRLSSTLPAKLREDTEPISNKKPSTAQVIQQKPIVEETFESDSESDGFNNFKDLNDLEDFDDFEEDHYESPPPVETKKPTQPTKVTTVVREDKVPIIQTKIAQPLPQQKKPLYRDPPKQEIEQELQFSDDSDGYNSDESISDGENFNDTIDEVDDVESERHDSSFEEYAFESPNSVMLVEEDDDDDFSDFGAEDIKKPSVSEKDQSFVEDFDSEDFDDFEPIEIEAVVDPEPKVIINQSEKATARTTETVVVQANKQRMETSNTTVVQSSVRSNRAVSQQVGESGSSDFEKPSINTRSNVLNPVENHSSPSPTRLEERHATNVKPLEPPVVKREDIIFPNKEIPTNVAQPKEVTTERQLPQAKQSTPSPTLTRQDQPPATEEKVFYYGTSKVAPKFHIEIVDETKNPSKSFTESTTNTIDFNRSISVNTDPPQPKVVKATTTTQTELDEQQSVPPPQPQHYHILPNPYGYPVSDPSYIPPPVSFFRQPFTPLSSFMAYKYSNPYSNVQQRPSPPQPKYEPYVPNKTAEKRSELADYQYQRTKHKLEAHIKNNESMKENIELQHNRESNSIRTELEGIRKLLQSTREEMNCLLYSSRITPTSQPTSYAPNISPFAPSTTQPTYTNLEHTKAYIARHRAPPMTRKQAEEIVDYQERSMII